VGKYARMLGVALIALVILSSLGGCSKAKRTGGEVAGPTPRVAAKSSGPAGIAAELKTKRESVKSYVMSMDMGGKMMTQTIKFENGQPIRMKIDLGAGGWMLVQKDKQVQYMYDPKSKTAMKMTMKETKGEAPGKVPGMKSPDLDEFKNLKTEVKSETVDGADCWLFELSQEGQGSVKSWVDKDHGLVRQMEMGGKIMKINYDQINSVPDSEFELPAGTKVQDMSSMGGMPSGR
jgi:outer membrane lipoprotein-sorting protein